MPYKSAAQRRYMHTAHPKIAAKWDEKYGGKVKKKKPQRKIQTRANRGGAHPNSPTKPTYKSNAKKIGRKRATY